MTDNAKPSKLSVIQSCAVLTRGMYDETPFLKEFVCHYLRLGFDRIYFINADTRHGYVNQCLDPQMSACVTVIDSANIGDDWQEPALNNALQLISEAWVLIVDLDEFLFLHGQKIQEYVTSQSLGCSKLRFRWLLALSKNYYENAIVDLLDGPLFSSKTGKVMVKRCSVHTLGLHDASMVDGCTMECTNDYAIDPFILHVACRGFLDLISRIVGRNYGNDKSGQDQEDRLRRFLSDASGGVDQFPFRFHMYRVQLTSEQVYLRLDHTTFAVLSGINAERALEVFKAKLDALGWPIRAVTLSEMEGEIESKSHLRTRLFRCTPDRRFIRMYLDDGMSYVNATHAYLRTLTSEDVRASFDSNV